MGKLTVAGLATLLAFAGQTAIAADNDHTKMFVFEIGPELLGDFSTINGSSAKLTRMDDGVSIRINTTELEPGAYTLWWVIFNDVEKCEDFAAIGACNPFVDLGIPQVGGAVLFGSGAIVRDNGVGHFRAFLETDFEPEDSEEGLRDKVLISNGGKGLQNPLTAEIHVVLRWHGPAALGNPDLLSKQIETSSGGCNNDSFFVPEDPDPNHRLVGCYDPQVGVFVSPLSP